MIRNNPDEYLELTIYIKGISEDVPIHKKESKSRHKCGISNS